MNTQMRLHTWFDPIDFSPALTNRPPPRPSISLALITFLSALWRYASLQKSSTNDSICIFFSDVFIFQDKCRVIKIRTGPNPVTFSDTDNLRSFQSSDFFTGYFSNLLGILLKMPNISTIWNDKKCSIIHKCFNPILMTLVLDDFRRTS